MKRWFQRFTSAATRAGAGRGRATRAAAGRARAGRSLEYATSPLLASPTPPWRSRLIVALVGLGFVGLLGRAAYVQIVASDFFQKEGDKRFLHTQGLPASRGTIHDRNGLVLATSVAMPTVQVETRLFNADARQRAALAKLLDMTAAELNQRLEAGGTVVLRRHVDEAVWQQVRALGLKGVPEIREYRRRYPEGESAAQLVGFTDIDETGKAGIEQSFEQQLLGRGGQRTVLRDRVGRVVEQVGDPVAPRDGGNLTLSIDSKIQFFAWQQARDAVQAHGAKGASVVVLDSTTGEVLAMANYPSFDPARRDLAAGALRYNRAVLDASEPGSTMKPFTVATALELKRVTPATMIDTAPGRITITGSTIHDAHVHGALSVAEVLQKSSNVGTVRLTERIERRELWETYTAVGFGQKPQIDFPALASGRLRPWKNWRPVEYATVSFGYGISASVLQMARAYTVFARDGDIAPLTLLRRDPAAGPVAGQRVFSPATAHEVRRMLQMAVSKGGTAPQVSQLTLGYSVGGKTGTAKKAQGKGYAEGKYRAWFVGLAPVSAPRIVVAVMVDEPSRGKYYAGDVAGPVFSHVVQQTLRMLNVPPDVDVKSQIGSKPLDAEPESI